MSPWNAAILLNSMFNLYWLSTPVPNGEPSVWFRGYFAATSALSVSVALGSQVDLIHASNCASVLTAWDIQISRLAEELQGTVPDRANLSDREQCPLVVHITWRAVKSDQD